LKTTTAFYIYHAFYNKILLIVISKFLNPITYRTIVNERSPQYAVIYIDTLFDFIIFLYGISKH